jgi:hypothetical protein
LRWNKWRQAGIAYEIGMPAASMILAAGAIES